MNIWKPSSDKSKLLNYVYLGPVENIFIDLSHA